MHASCMHHKACTVCHLRSTRCSTSFPPARPRAGRPSTSCAGALHAACMHARGCTQCACMLCTCTAFAWPGWRCQRSSGLTKAAGHQALAHRAECRHTVRAVHCTHARPAGRRRGYEAEDDNTWEPAGHLHKDLVRVGTSPPPSPNRIPTSPLFLRPRPALPAALTETTPGFARPTHPPPQRPPACAAGAVWRPLEPPPPPPLLSSSPPLQPLEPATPVTPK